MCCAAGPAAVVVSVQPAAAIADLTLPALPALLLLPPVKTTTRTTTSAIATAPPAPQRMLRLCSGVSPPPPVWRCCGACTLRGGGGVRGFLATGAPGYQAAVSASAPKKATTAARSEVTGQEGSDSRNARP